MIVELLIGAVAVGGVAVLVRRRRRAEVVFDPRGLGLGLEPEEGGRRWRGRHGLTEVWLERLGEDRHLLSVRHNRPIELSAGRDGALSRPLYGPEVKTRDEDFDRVVRLAGDELAIFAVLDPAARATIRRAVLAGWRAERGTWQIELDGSEDPASISELATRLPLITAAPSELAKRLFATLRQPDTLFWPRARALELLAGLPNPAPTLARLVASPVEPWLRARALTALAEKLPHHGETISAVTGFAAAADAIPHEIAKALASVMASVPHPDPEGVLLRLVERDEREVAFAAMNELAQLGTIERTVPVLVRLRDRAFATELGARAREVIAALQQRANAEAGGLMLAPTHEGGLALSDEPAAAQTVAGPGPQRLS